MSYRTPEQTPLVCSVPTQVGVHLLNGTTFEVILTCSYVQPAVPPATEDTTVPIHLIAEGYGEPVVAFEPQAPGLTGTAWVDPADDGRVYCVFSAQCPSAVAVDVRCEASVLITRLDANNVPRTDCILRALVEIEDAPLPGTTPQPGT